MLAPGSLRHSCSVGSILVVLVAIASPGALAEAQTQPTAEVRQEARERFARALELYDEGLLEQALVEFRRAYELAPAPQVLFNLGQVHASLGQAVEAVDAFERYLAELGARVPADRRVAVESELRRQRARIAFLDVHANVEGAVLWIDDLERGPVGGDPVRVTSGTVLVELRAPHHEPYRTTVRIAGGLTQRVDAVLEPMPVATGRIRVVSRTREVRVSIDGREVGTTPLPDTIAVEPGPHVVVGERAGYTPVRREVDVARAEQEEVDLSLDVAEVATTGVGRVRLLLPVRAIAISVDGQSIEPAFELPLPRGEHDLDIVVPGRQPYRTTVLVEDSATTEVAPRLTWIDHEARIEGNRSQTRDATIVIGVGIALDVIGVVTSAIMFASLGEQDAHEERCTIRGAAACGTSSAFAQLATTEGGLWTLAGVSGIAGLIVTGVGVGLLLGAGTDADVEASASYQVALGPGSIAIEGAF